MDFRILRNLHRAAVARTNPCRDRDIVRFYNDFREGLLEGDIAANDYSLADAWDHFVENGYQLRQEFNPEKRVNAFQLELLEDNQYVSTTAFTNLTGQIVYSRIMENFKQRRSGIGILHVQE